MTTPFLMPTPSFLLKLEIGKVLATFRSGMHRSVRSGQGVDFKGIRPYDPSSDRPADIHYPASFKLSEDLDILVSRTRYAEKEISVLTLVDMGETMMIPPRKTEHASVLLWLFALSAMKYRDRFRLMLCYKRETIDSDWLRSKEVLAEWIMHAESRLHPLAGAAVSSHLFSRLVNLDLHDTLITVISDFTAEWKGGPEELTRLGMFERNIIMVLFALDEWSEFAATGYGMHMRDPQTGRTRYFSNAELLEEKRLAKARFERIALDVKHFSIPFIAIPLLADPLETVRREWLRYGFK